MTPAISAALTIGPRVAGGRPSGRQRLFRVVQLAQLLGSACHYCAVELDLEDTTLDHVWPFALGGRNNLRNLVLACSACNVRLADDVVKCFCRRCRRVWLPIVNARLRADFSRL